MDRKLYVSDQMNIGMNFKEIFFWGLHPNEYPLGLFWGLHPMKDSVSKLQRFLDNRISSLVVFCGRFRNSKKNSVNNGNILNHSFRFYFLVRYCFLKLRINLWLGVREITLYIKHTFTNIIVTPSASDIIPGGRFSKNLRYRNSQSTEKWHILRKLRAKYMVRAKWIRNHLRCVASFISTLLKNNNHYLTDEK